MARTGDVTVLNRLTAREQLGASAWVAAVCARHGHPDLARVLLERSSSADVEAMPMRHGDLGVLCMLAEAYYELRDVTTAARLYARLQPYAAYNAVGIVLDYRGSVAYHLGMLSLLLDRPQPAVEHLQRALAFNTSLGMPLQVGRTRELLARASALI